MSKISFNYEDEDRKINMELDSLTATEITRDFYYFMLSVSFNKNSILSALESISEEYQERKEVNENE